MHKSLYEHMLFFLLGRYIEVAWLAYMEGAFNFLKTAKLFPKWLYHFALSTAAYESSSFSPSLPILSIVGLFDFSLSNRYVVVYHYDTNLHFPNDVERRSLPFIYLLFKIIYLPIYFGCSGS